MAAILGALTLGLFALLTALGLFLGTDLSLVSLLAVLFAAAVVLFTSAWQHRQWSKQLAVSGGVSAPVQSSTVRFTLYDVFAGTTVIGVLVGAWLYCMKTLPPAIGEHVSRDRVPIHLPSDAEDVSYFNQGFSPLTFAEFTCSEAAFREWVNEGIGTLESQQSSTKLKSVGLIRLWRHLPQLGSDTNVRQALVTRGLEYYWHKEDRQVRAVFDLDTRRGYYLITTR